VLAEDWLAMPVIKGRKTESEKFAGAEYTKSIEALMSDGRALQSGTSHHLGQNFTKAYDITYADKENQRSYPYGTSWGLSTRVIGGVIMCHGDDAGLIMPPRVAPIQVVIVPIYRGDERAVVDAAVSELKASLTGIRLHVDDRDEKPGYKYNHWELRGVPLRVELGPRDIEAGQAMVVDRIDREKVAVPIGELPARLTEMLEQFQVRLFERAVAMRESFTVEVSSRAALEAAYADGKQALARGPWCGGASCELEIKDATRGVTIRSIVEDQASGNCAGCGKPAKHTVFWARAY
jgi:prolyl-tRNA synthetase